MEISIAVVKTLMLAPSKSRSLFASAIKCECELIIKTQKTLYCMVIANNNFASIESYVCDLSSFCRFKSAS